MKNNVLRAGSEYSISRFVSINCRGTSFININGLCTHQVETRKFYNVCSHMACTHAHVVSCTSYTVF